MEPSPRFSPPRPSCQPQVVPVLAVSSPDEDYPLEWLVAERAISTNTAAAGGNASLMSIG